MALGAADARCAVEEDYRIEHAHARVVRHICCKSNFGAIRRSTTFASGAHGGAGGGGKK
jgi:hypothetical protein